LPDVTTTTMAAVTATMTAITAAAITFRFLLPPPPPCRARLDGPAPITGIGAVEGSDAYHGPDDLLPPESLVTQGKVPTRKFRHKRSCYTHPGRRPLVWGDDARWPAALADRRPARQPPGDRRTPPGHAAVRQRQAGSRVSRTGGGTHARSESLALNIRRTRDDRDMTSAEFTNAHPALAQFWHPVALSSDVGREPVAGRLGGQGWALARFGGGLTAFADACPHRRARLSAGQITDGILQCPYHGWRFTSDGRCVGIPAL